MDIDEVLARLDPNLAIDLGIEHIPALTTEPVLGKVRILSHDKVIHVWDPVLVQKEVTPDSLYPYRIKLLEDLEWSNHIYESITITKMEIYYSGTWHLCEQNYPILLEPEGKVEVSP